MHVENVDLVALVAVVMVFSIPLVPLMSRLMLKPLLDTFVRARADGEVEALKRRVEALEYRLEMAQGPKPLPVSVTNAAAALPERTN